MVQDEYSRLSRNASVGVHGYALVFSIVSRQSFNGISSINESLLNALGDALDIPRVLVGSMRDLSDQRQVSTEVSEIDQNNVEWLFFLCVMNHLLLFLPCYILSQDAQALADSWGVPYLECSSKTGENVAEVFHTLLKEIEKDDGLLNEEEENGCIIL